MTTKRKIVVVLLLLFTVSAAGSTALLAYQAKKMVHLMDLNNSGTLEFYEVGPLIREKFAQFDKDGDTKLSQMEVTRYVLSGLVQGLSNSIKDKGPQIVSASDVVSLKDLQAALNEMVVALELPGATFVAGKNGKELVRFSNGTINPETVVPIASASKWLSAATVILSAESAGFTMDQELQEFMPDLPSHWGGVTWEQLLSHTSGAAEGHAVEYSPQGAYANQFFELIRQPVQDLPGASFSYGGVSMQVAGFALEQTMRRPWSSLFHEFVAGPLGMHDTFYGHPMWDKKDAEIRTPNIAGGVHSNADDYFKFLSALFPSSLRNKSLLTAKLIKRIESDMTSSLPQAFRPPVVSDSWSYGLGMWCERRLDGACMTVNSAGGFGTFPWIDRTTGSYGVLVTVGSGKDVLPHAIHIRSLFETFLDVEERK